MQSLTREDECFLRNEHLSICTKVNSQMYLNIELKTEIKEV
jgi:hypothetical protein